MSFLGVLGDVIGTVAPIVAGAVIGGPAGAAVGAGVGTLASSVGKNADASEAFEQKLALQHDQQQWQRDENALDRRFNADQADINRQFQTSEREAAQDWNSAPQQVQRLQSAGLNASAILGGAGAGSAAGSTTPMSGDMAQSTSHPLPAYPIETAAEIAMKAQSTQGAYIKSISGAIKDMKEAGAKDTEIQKMYAEIGKITSEQRLTELKAEGQELTNQIVRLTGNRRAEAEIANIIASAQLQLQKIETEKEQGKLIKEQRLTEIFRGVNEQFQGLLKKSEYEKSLIDLKYWEEQWLDRFKTTEEERKTMQSEQGRNNADARKSRAEAAYKEYENDLRDKTKDEALDALVGRLYADGLISAKDAEEAQRKIDVIRKARQSGKFLKGVDDTLEWLKGKVSIFN